MKELMNLLQQKNKLLTDLLSFVKSKNFYGDESEAQEIIAFVDEKQGYIDKLNELEKRIKAYPQNKGVYKEVNDLADKNNELINSILTVEKQNMSVMKYLMDKFKQNMKGAKIQQQ